MSQMRKMLSSTNLSPLQKDMMGEKRKKEKKTLQFNAKL